MRTRAQEQLVITDETACRVTFLWSKRPSPRGTVSALPSFASVSVGRLNLSEALDLRFAIVFLFFPMTKNFLFLRDYSDFTSATNLLRVDLPLRAQGLSCALCDLG